MHTREEQMEAFGRLLDVLDQLREKCPWDHKQTNESLRPNTIEETFELCDAIMRNDHHDMMKELGDVLMHVCFYAMIAREERRYDIADVLNTETRQALFPADLPVFTKVRDEMPARYGENVTCVNSLVADGCIIEGTVENSVLFRGVRIAPDAHVKNCIIMQDGQVHSGAYIENCILDKQAVIKRNARLIGPDAYPIVIAKNVVI